MSGAVALGEARAVSTAVARGAAVASGTAPMRELRP